jgi:DNA-binding MarR family transcriptional regulator
VKTKSDLVDEINGLIGAVGDKFDAEEGDPERDYMEGPVSVVGLAARADQLKGTVSKHVQRLVGAGLVERTPIPGNRKEVTLSLTADGKLVADVHQRMHDEMKRGVAEFLARYNNAELSVLTKMLRDFLSADKVGVRIVQGPE